MSAADLPPLDLTPEQAEEARRLARIELAAPAVDPWGEPYTMADAYADRPPVRFAAGVLFELPSLNIIYGPPGCYKTFAMMDLAACIVAGRPWLEPLSGEGQGMKTTQGPAMWIDQDQGKRRTLDRFAALGRAHGLPPDAPLFAWAMPGFNASDPESVAALVKRAKDRQVKFIALDNLGTITGGPDENSSQMIKVMAGLRRLAEETGAAVAVLHHQSKAPKEPGRRLGNSLRGHSSIEASLDCALLIERDGQSDHFAAQTTKARGVDVPPFAAVFVFDPPDPGATLHTARFYGVQSDYNQSAYAVDVAIMTILEEKAGERMNQTALISSVKEAHPTTWHGLIKERLAALVKVGKLTVSTGPRNSKLYEAGK